MNEFEQIPNQSVNSNNNQSIDTDIANLELDLERISIGEHLYDTVKCGLCYLISGSPLVLKCCENIICTSCTNSWMQKNNHNCPICREKNFKYSKPNRFEKIFSFQLNISVLIKLMDVRKRI